MLTFNRESALLIKRLYSACCVSVRLSSEINSDERILCPGTFTHIGTIRNEYRQRLSTPRSISISANRPPSVKLFR